MPVIDVYGHLGTWPWLNADRDALLRAMQRARIDTTVVSSRLAVTSNFVEGNYKLKAAIDGVPQFLGYVVVNPTYVEQSIGEMRRYLNAPNIVGVKLHPDASGQPLDSAATHEVVNAYRRYSKPLLVHVRGSAQVRALATLAAAAPNLKMIVAHAGGDAFAECLALATRQLNLLLEPFTGGSERGKIEEAVEKIGAHRVLFGTNFPSLNPGVALGMLADASLSESDRNLILGGNTAKLFQLDRRPAAAEDEAA
jgi:predicted TIM-barrel fold metal-dependent hydrolase